jgi:diguanylate cyclase (GGDEF)-like protein
MSATRQVSVGVSDRSCQLFRMWRLPLFVVSNASLSTRFVADGFGAPVMTPVNSPEPSDHRRMSMRGSFFSDFSGDPSAEQPLRVLLVDPAHQTRAAVSRVLAAQHDVLGVGSPAEGIDRASRERPDIIVVDITSSSIDIHDFFRQLKRDAVTAQIPVILTVDSAAASATVEAKALRMGAVDFIRQPSDAAVLLARVALQLRLARERRLLTRMADLDGLTGIANRRQFDRALSSEWQRALRDGAEVSVVMIDIDHFKPYNDRHGHAVGDSALRAVAETLHGALRRPGDLAARYGGEEFALLISGSEHDATMKLAHSLRTKVQALGMEHGASSAAPVVTISMGVATAAAHPEIAAQELLELADERLYQAKKEGRNRVVGDDGSAGVCL